MVVRLPPFRHKFTTFFLFYTKILRKLLCCADDTLYSPNPSYGIEDGEEEDGSGGLAEQMIEFAPFVDAAHAPPVDEVDGQEQ